MKCYETVSLDNLFKNQMHLIRQEMLKKYNITALNQNHNVKKEYLKKYKKNKKIFFNLHLVNYSFTLEKNILEKYKINSLYDDNKALKEYKQKYTQLCYNYERGYINLEDINFCKEIKFE